MVVLFNINKVLFNTHVKREIAKGHWILRVPFKGVGLKGVFILGPVWRAIKVMVNAGINYFVPIARLVTVALLIPKTGFYVVHAKRSLVASSNP